MNQIKDKLRSSPAFARAFPFLLFLGLTMLQDSFGVTGKYWVYFAKTLVGIWLIWQFRPFISEMRWAFSWEAVVVGVAVFALWVGLDSYYPHFGSNSGTIDPSKLLQKQWNPLAQYGAASVLGWFFVAVRILGSAFVVPPLEETFYRSFVYRYIANPDFQKLPLRHFSALSFVVTAAIFGFAHYQWLAGILCAMAYQWLVIRKDRLGDAMTAHAITNFLLGVWVVWRCDWKFW